jgi:hypothetical protein
MTATEGSLDDSRYARCIQSSKRVRWDIDDDVIRGRRFDTAHKFLPDGLSLVEAFTTLSPGEKRFVSQIQGRTYANVFGLVERFINAKILELGRDHALGDQEAVEALVRFSAEELKHQALFRRIDAMVSQVLPDGYRFDVDPNAVGRTVLAKGNWAVLALTLHIELFTQLHYRRSIDPDSELSGLFKDVFLYHWKEECQHAILDELELVRHDATLSAEERDRGDMSRLSRPAPEPTGFAPLPVVTRRTRWWLRLRAFSCAARPKTTGPEPRFPGRSRRTRRGIGVIFSADAS